jgi:hypothetical protein
MANSIRIFKNLYNVLVTKAVLYYEIFIIGIKTFQLIFIWNIVLSALTQVAHTDISANELL